MSALYNYRGLIWNFVKRDISSKYAGSLLGLYWSVINPIIILVIYFVVRDIDFEVPKGTTVGIIGQNGSGILNRCYSDIGVIFELPFHTNEKVRNMKLGNYGYVSA